VAVSLFRIFNLFAHIVRVYHSSNLLPLTRHCCGSLRARKIAALGCNQNWRILMEREFPELLKKFHCIEIDYADGDGIDFEPYDSFYSENDTSEWIKAWTGNEDLNGNEYLIFGQDGTGGYGAFWLVRKTKDLLLQPIVFFGSEGELGVVAQSFYDYVWLFAQGVGPYEAVEYPGIERNENQNFITFAEKYAHSYKNSVSEIMAKANNEFPNFKATIQSLCR